MNNFMPELIGAISDKGPVRSANEDAYWVSHAETPVELGALYLVADGVGGQEAGDVAARKATEIISHEFYERRRKGEEIPAALEQAIRAANQIIYQLSQTRGGGKMGCTIVTAVLHDSLLYVAHVGDARAYFLMGDKLKRLTRDDTWVQKQVEAGVITPKEAAAHELRNVVTQVLGNKEQIEVHLTQPLEVYSNDVFLLCSDGLYDPLSFQKIQLLLYGKAAQTAAEDLVQAAINAQTHDNVTAVVVNVGQIPGKVRAGSPAGSGKQPGIPAWVFATLIATVILLLAILFFFVLPALNPGEESSEATEVPATNLPAEIVPVETEEPVLEVNTIEATTAVIVLTATGNATATLEPLPTNTPAATDTPPPPIQARGCIIFESFIWQDAEITSNSCTEFADASIANAQEVIILENSPLIVNGPDSACEENSFLKIQSVEDPSLEGWVLANSILPLPPGENCSP